MKVQTELLFGEQGELWRITCAADVPDAKSKMLKAASRLIKDDPEDDVEVGSVHLSGLTWDSEDDVYELIVILGIL